MAARARRRHPRALEAVVGSARKTITCQRRWRGTECASGGETPGVRERPSYRHLTVTRRCPVTTIVGLRCSGAPRVVERDRSSGVIGEVGHRPTASIRVARIDRLRRAAHLDGSGSSGGQAATRYHSVSAPSSVSRDEQPMIGASSATTLRFSWAAPRLRGLVRRRDARFG